MRMIRAVLVLSCLASPAPAWEFAQTPLCTVSHDEANLSFEMTYDPGLPEYALHLTLKSGGWPSGAVFSLRFEGPAGLTISTNRHVIEGTTLSVTDRGFGNVLNGLQFNVRAVALIGASEFPISLDGAAPSIEAFRDCNLPLA